MNILIAADSFKDALPAKEVCRAIESGLLRSNATIKTRCFPLADGGEDTFDVLSEHLNLQKITVPASDPLQRPISAAYGISADGQTAFIEMAKTAGLQLLSVQERNPLKTNTRGVGQQIADALQRGVQHIVLAIGGSATNDAGMGMAVALGWRFLDQHGNDLEPTGENLVWVYTIVAPTTNVAKNITTSVICDVTNPLFGKEGAAFVYAHQKGADNAAITLLDNGLRRFSAIAKGPSPWLPGAGAAGGMGFGALLFLNAQLQRGIDLMLDLTQFDNALQWADLVITGEGKIDAQTAYGKLIHGICQRAAAAQKPVIAFCGKLDATAADIQKIGLQAAYSINPPGVTNLAEMLRDTKLNIEKSAHHLAQVLW